MRKLSSTATLGLAVLTGSTGALFLTVWGTAALFGSISKPVPVADTPTPVVQSTTQPAPAAVSSPAPTAPVATAEAAPAATSTSAPTTSTQVATPTPAPTYKYSEMMGAAGIASSDYGYVSDMVLNDGGWRLTGPNLWQHANNGNVGTSMPLVWNLERVNYYVTKTYGTWAAAHAQWVSTGDF